MSKLLTYLKFSMSQIYPKNADLSAQSTFYVKTFLIKGQGFNYLKSCSIEIASSI
jgi:hypothetical protein